MKKIALALLCASLIIPVSQCNASPMAFITDSKNPELFALQVALAAAGTSLFYKCLASAIDADTVRLTRGHDHLNHEQSVKKEYEKLKNSAFYGMGLALTFSISCLSDTFLKKY